MVDSSVESKLESISRTIVKPLVEAQVESMVEAQVESKLSKIETLLSNLLKTTDQTTGHSSVESKRSKIDEVHPKPSKTKPSVESMPREGDFVSCVFEKTATSPGGFHIGKIVHVNADALDEDHQVQAFFPTYETTDPEEKTEIFAIKNIGMCASHKACIIRHASHKACTVPREEERLQHLQVPL